jgi:hypothetical protein
MMHKIIFDILIFINVGALMRLFLIKNIYTIIRVDKLYFFLLIFVVFCVVFFGGVRVTYICSFLCCVFGGVRVTYICSFLCCVFGRVRVTYICRVDKLYFF